MAEDSLPVLFSPITLSFYTPTCLAVSYYYYYISAVFSHPIACISCTPCLLLFAPPCLSFCTPLSVFLRPLACLCTPPCMPLSPLFACLLRLFLVSLLALPIFFNAFLSFYSLGCLFWIELDSPLVCTSCTYLPIFLHTVPAVF